MAGLDTYIAKPSSSNPPKGIVLLITDIFGAHRKNPRLFCDRLAASSSSSNAGGGAGVAVVMPDFFKGDAWPADAPLSAEKFQGWLSKHPRERVMADALAVIEEAREKLSPEGSSKPLPVSAVGFCWGGLYATLLAGKRESDGKDSENASAAAVASAVLLHPSLLTLDEFKSVEAPMLVLFTGEDAQVPDKFRAEITQVLDEKKRSAKTDTSYHYYEEQRHGFSLRGDDTDAKIAKAATDALERTAAWIKEHGTAA